MEKTFKENEESWKGSERPIMCTLGDTEFREREATIIKDLMAKLSGITEIDDGFIYKFTVQEGLKDELDEFTSLERECCGFLDFDISNDAEAGELVLTITGPDEAKEFIAATFKK